MEIAIASTELASLLDVIASLSTYPSQSVRGWVGITLKVMFLDLRDGFQLSHLPNVRTAQLIFKENYNRISLVCLFSQCNN